MNDRRAHDAPPGPAARPDEADTPREAHDAVAPEVRRLRLGDDAPQEDDQRED